MRLLFDHNLSPALVSSLAELFPDSTHVRTVGLHRADDQAIWTYAAQHQLTIVSKDSDFRQMSFVFGPPPKIIWIRRGNCSTRAIEELLREHVEAIEGFQKDETAAFLAIG